MVAPGGRRRRPRLTSPSGGRVAPHPGLRRGLRNAELSLLLLDTRTRSLGGWGPVLSSSRARAWKPWLALLPLRLPKTWRLLVPTVSRVGGVGVRCALTGLGGGPGSQGLGEPASCRGARQQALGTCWFSDIS